MTNDIFGRTVEIFTDSDTDWYRVGGAISFPFPTGTPTEAAYLSIAIQSQLGFFMQSLRDFGQLHYDTITQANFVEMYLAAQAAGLTNRAAYIKQGLDWFNSVLTYAASYITLIKSQKSPEDVTSLEWDFTQIPTDPKITLVGAISITD